MARTILFTGFPGFIGRRLVARILQREGSAELVCLVQSKFLAQARAEADRIVSRLGLERSRLSMLAGDITQPQLGLGEGYAALAERVAEVWHLAAVYDLAVGEDLARKVNVEGTQHVLELCRAAPSLERLVYYSTCYVAGTRTGLVREDDLVHGQGFKNFYESTKFAAEVLVRQAMEKGLKAVIIRPSIVVGDSKTGETDKFDGPYNTFKFLYKLRALPLPMPLVGPSDAEVNIVPVDFLVDATMAISEKREALGKTFQVADPRPIKAAALYDLACRLVTGRGAAGFSLPPALLERTLAVGAVRGWLGVPKQVLAYFNHQTHFDTTNTLAMLEGTGIHAPAVKDYFPMLYRFWLEHRDEPGFEAKV